MTSVAFDMLLDGHEVDVRIGAADTTADYTLDMDSTAALVITMRDQQRKLLASGLLDSNADGKLDRSVEVTVDGAIYRLAQVQKAGDQFTLTWEDRLVSRMRSLRVRTKARHGEDHVRFARRLVARAGGMLVTPTGVAVVEDAKPLKHKQLRAAADDRRERGIADAADLTISDDGGNKVKLGAERIRVAEAMLGVAAQEQASERATEALIADGIVESLLVNLGGGDRDSVGVLQVRVGLHGAVASSITGSSRLFLLKGFTGAGGAIALAKAHPDWTAGRIAQTVQGSAFPLRYDKHADEAKAIIAAYGGTGAVGGGTEGTRAAVLLQVGTPEAPDEDFWTALGRIAAAKGYRLHALRNRVYYGREQDWILSRPLATISEQSPGIDWIDWEWSPNKHVNTASIVCRAAAWSVLPGSSVMVAEAKGCPANGRWLVSSVARSRYSSSCAIEIRRGTELLQPESQGEVGVSLTLTEGQSADDGTVWAEAQTISDQHRGYVYGGGHGVALSSIEPRAGLDCSSSCALALKRAGMFNGTQAIVSGQFAATWGQPGRGKTFTVWANAGHVWIEFHGEHDGYNFNTAGHPGDRGPRLVKNNYGSGGFTPRHWPGR